jgi:hypothetical protein
MYLFATTVVIQGTFRTNVPRRMNNLRASTTTEKPFGKVEDEKRLRGDAPSQWPDPSASQSHSQTEDYSTLLATLEAKLARVGEIRINCLRQVLGSAERTAEAYGSSDFSRLLLPYPF